MAYIGVDLGGTNIAVGVVSDDARIITQASIPTLHQRSIEAITDDICELCSILVNGTGMSMDNIDVVGVGCPGTINHKKGIVVYSNNLQMENVPLCEILKRKIGKPVHVENDANAAALGEYLVNGNHAESFVFITLGTGIGGGIIINEELYRGFNGAGGELGHIIINTDSKEQCTCGNHGCWESYASVTALIRQTKTAMQKDRNSIMNQWALKHGKVSGRTAFECAKQGDDTAKAVVDQYIKFVGAGLISVLNIFQPEVILIGGGISKEGDYLLDPLRDYVYAGDYNKFMKKTKIDAASLFNDAGIIGAAFSAYE